MTYRPTPPPTPRAVSPADVLRVDAMLAMGITQRAVAMHLGCHWRTVHNVVARKGAYQGVPK